MAWVRDGRLGIGMIGGIPHEGFALMRDPGKKLIAFHLNPLRNVDVTPQSSEVVISEDAFEPEPISSASQARTG